MCGIAGVFGLEDRLLMNRMTHVIRHRGPDEEGFFSDRNIMLGQQRLKVIDLHTGTQPIYNEDRSLCIIHSGEVYNFPELREQLERKGHRFFTGTDTEVIVHSYEEYGPKCVDDFIGMFAFAIWDSNKKELFLARDKNGIKPLYYTIAPDGVFLFGSEIKSLLQYDAVPREVDIDSFHYYVNLRYLPRDKTMFRGIKKLPPAHTMTVSKKGIEMNEFWSASMNITSHDEDHYVKQLDHYFKKAIKRHMISDVPVGFLLSGGIDSSTAVAMASQVTEEPLRTFCMGFGEDTDEMDDAQIVADHFSTNHLNLVIKGNILKEYPKMIWYADSPKRNLYTYYLYELVSKHSTVVLSGLGGDELFGGYTWKYDYAAAVEKLRGNVSPQERKRASGIASELHEFQVLDGAIDDDRFIEYMKKIKYIDSNTDLYLQIQTLDEVFDDPYLQKIYGDRIDLEKIEPVRNAYAPYFVNDEPFLHQIYLADYKIKMVDDFIFVDDAMSMAHSLECRVPFLDNELVDFAFTIPPSLKYNNGVSKYILKKTAAPYLPKEVLKKPKKGFGTNVFLTYKWELADIARQLLPEGNLVKEGYINREYPERILNHTPSPDLTKHYSVLWSLLAFEIWYEIYIKGDNVYDPELKLDRFV